MINEQKSRLGNDPLENLANPHTAGIFQKTALEPKEQPLEDAKNAPEGGHDNFLYSVDQNPEKRFLTSEQALEKVTLRIPIELNDWLDDLLKQGKRKHGQKIPKEIWLQASLELLRAAPIEWTDIESIDHLRETLQILEKGMQKKES